MAPKVFKERQLAETPTTDPKAIVGRNVEVSLAELINNPSKGYIKLTFKVDKIAGKQAFTHFNGMAVAKEQLYRLVRKRASKVEVIDHVTTKDNWILQLSTFVILNKKVEAGVQSAVRKFVVDFFKKKAQEETHAQFVEHICASSFQKAIKTEGSKIHPIRFCEVIKLEVVKANLAEPMKVAAK